MRYGYQQPHPSLSPYIRTILVLEGFVEPDTNQLPLFTNGMPALFCRTEKDQAGNEQVMQLTLFGKSTTPECWAVNPTTTIIAYFFQPFAVSCLFNLPAATLVKDPVELSSWNAHQTNALIMQLVYTTATSQKRDVLDHVLLHQLEQHKRECEVIRYATDQIMHNPNTEILPTILKELDLNIRTFQRMFKKYVGVTPSQYRRICQFQFSFTHLRSKQFENLADLAYEHGFADQSHFTRSFKEFTQTTPNDYLRSGLKEKGQ
jgi:AraC-like DNA-binding protein